MAAAPTPPASPNGADDKLDRGVLMIASVVVLGAIMSILDVTVVNVAINTLAKEFDSPLSTIQWVVTGYTLALATVIPLTGWAADRFGTKRLYLTSIFLFVCGSMLSGLAWSAESLIGFRILQGFGGGMIMPLGMTILTRAAGPQRVGRVMAIIGVPMLLGPILGPILGGWLVDAASWRWIFFINLPIGIAALIASQRILARDVPQPGHRLDVVGLALLSPGLALLIYGLAETSGDGGFGRWQVIGPGLVGLAMLAGFVVHGLRTRTTEALIDLRLFANRVFAASSVTLVLVIIAVFGGMLLLPLYLQVVRGESAMDTGLLLAPQGLGAMVAMPIAGRLTDRTGVGRIVPVGLVIVGISFLGLTQLAADTSYWTLSGLLFLMGLGMGATMMPTFSGAMQTLRRAAIARASTTLNIEQQVGASIGTAVLSVLLTHELTSRLGGGGGGGIGTSLPPAVRERVAPAMAEAFGATFWYALALVVVAFVVAIVLLPKEKPEPLDEPDDAEAAAAPVLVAH